jgi:hypothetical protein
MIEELVIKTELVCGELVFRPGDIVTGIRVGEKAYKIFLPNGWWVVDAEHFTQQVDTPDANCQRCNKPFDYHLTEDGLKCDGFKAKRR